MILNSPNEKLMIVLYKMSKALDDELLRELKPHGINKTEFLILGKLYNDGLVPMQQLGEVGQITSGTITYVVNQLIQKGYVTREKCPTDQRIYYASLTPQGKSFWEIAYNDHLMQLDNKLAALSETDRNQAILLIKQLGKLLED